MQHHVAIVLGILLFATSPLIAHDKLNVLFIISDDLAATALASYGNAQCKTPHIDKLAARGVRFDRAYCQFPICGPSRAAIMSGLYCQQIGVLRNGDASRFARNLGDRPTMAQHFKANGYYTARIGKIYHMGIPGDIVVGVAGPDHPTDWTERFNFKCPEQYSDGDDEMLSNEKVNFDRKMPYGSGAGSAMYAIQTSTDGAEQHDMRAADKAIELLTAHKDEPFFLALGFIRPHVPLVAPASYFKTYPPAEMRLAEKRDGDLDDIPRAGYPYWMEGQRGMTDPAQQRKALASYYACVSFMDSQVGRVLDTLDQLGLTENTIVVFCSDHGWHLGEHTFWQKMSLHEESAKIPLIIAAPGKKPAVAEALAEQIDIYPTLSALAGLPIPPHCAGKSLIPVLNDPAATVRDFAYSIRHNADHLIRTDRWSYMQYSDGSAELYDMHNDRKQFTNLANDSARADVIAEMKGKLAVKIELMK